MGNDRKPRPHGETTVTENVVSIAPGSSGSRRTQLPEEVASYVRELIITGAVRPGDYLRMEPIAAALGVSNTPVREGLLALRGQGFVQLVPRRGFVVAEFTPQDIRDLFWVQAQLASELTARAATTITSTQLDRLNRNLQEYEEAIADGDSQRIADLGHQFHREINQAADSQRLTLLLGSVVKQLPNRFYAEIEGRIESTRAAHLVLVAALRKGQARRARTVMEAHILEGGDRLIESLERNAPWGAETAS